MSYIRTAVTMSPSVLSRTSERRTRRFLSVVPDPAGVTHTVRCLVAGILIAAAVSVAGSGGEQKAVAGRNVNKPTHPGVRP